MLAGTTGKAPKGCRSERLGWCKFRFGAGLSAWNRVLVSSCAIVFGYDRRGGSEGDRWAAATRIASAGERSDGGV